MSQPSEQRHKSGTERRHSQPDGDDRQHSQPEEQAVRRTVGRPQPGHSDVAMGERQQRMDPRDRDHITQQVEDDTASSDTDPDHGQGGSIKHAEMGLRPCDCLRLYHHR